MRTLLIVALIFGCKPKEAGQVSGHFEQQRCDGPSGYKAQFAQDAANPEVGALLGELACYYMLVSDVDYRNKLFAFAEENAESIDLLGLHPRTSQVTYDGILVEELAGRDGRLFQRAILTAGDTPMSGYFKALAREFGGSSTDNPKIKKFCTQDLARLLRSKTGKIPSPFPPEGGTIDVKTAIAKCESEGFPVKEIAEEAKKSKGPTNLEKYLVGLKNMCSVIPREMRSISNLDQRHHKSATREDSYLVSIYRCSIPVFGEYKFVAELRKACTSIRTHRPCAYIMNLPLDPGSRFACIQATRRAQDDDDVAYRISEEACLDLIEAEELKTVNSEASPKRPETFSLTDSTPLHAIGRYCVSCHNDESDKSTWLKGVSLENVVARLNLCSRNALTKLGAMARYYETAANKGFAHPFPRDMFERWFNQNLVRLRATGGKEVRYCVPEKK